MKKFNLKSGFTLIELMVVISIIAILSVIVFASFGDARSQSRDKVRMNDLKQVQVALTLYKAQNGSYPAQGCTGGGGTEFSGVSAPLAGFSVQCTNYIAGLVPDYIEVLPTDPSGSEAGKGFFYRSDGNSFKLMVVGVESMKVSSFNEPFARCPVSISGSSACSGTTPPDDTYAVYSKGAESW